MPVEIDNVIHQVYVLKRPYVDEFLCRMGELFECVLFTASLAKVRRLIFNLNVKCDFIGSVSASIESLLSDFYILFYE